LKTEEQMFAKMTKGQEKTKEKGGRKGGFHRQLWVNSKVEPGESKLVCMREGCKQGGRERAETKGTRDRGSPLAGERLFY